MFEQTDRPMKLTTPLGPNALLLVGLQGREAISQMFHFELKTAWNDNPKLLPFDQLLPIYLADQQVGVLAHDPHRDPLVLPEQAEQQVLGADVVVVQLQRFTQR